MFSTLKGMMSPSKPSKSDNDAPQVNDAPTPSATRGIKRKADPYDVIEDDGDDAQSRATPTQRVLSRLSSEAPSSASRSKVTYGKKKRRSRSTPKREADGPIVAAPQSAGTGDENPRGSMVPVADMGGAGLFDGKADAGNKNIDATSTEVPAETDARELLENAREKRAEENEEEGEEREVDRLLKHRRNDDGSVDLLVKWAGETEKESTWEAESELQKGAAETIYEYWKAQGGRSEVLFYNAKPEVPEVYHVFQILRHEKKGTIFQFEVQWVGYPPTPGNTTMEPEAKLKKIAPELVNEYWESKGGRAKFLAKRGRAKRSQD